MNQSSSWRKCVTARSKTNVPNKRYLIFGKSDYSKVGYSNHQGFRSTPFLHVFFST